MSLEEKIQSKIEELKAKKKEVKEKHKNKSKNINALVSIRDAFLVVKYTHQIEVLKSILE